jgi:hypothetical protein
LAHAIQAAPDPLLDCREPCVELELADLPHRCGECTELPLHLAAQPRRRVRARLQLRDLLCQRRPW